MFRKIKNKKGYTMTYAIVIIGVLMLLTASVIMVTFFNFKMARIGGNVNTSFYANDGALEEAITELNIMVTNAEIEAWAHVNSPAFSTLDWQAFIQSLTININGGRLSYDQGNRILNDAYLWNM
jgi:hypothetical protein